MINKIGIGFRMSEAHDLIDYQVGHQFYARQSFVSHATIVCSASGQEDRVNDPLSFFQSQDSVIITKFSHFTAVGMKPGGIELFKSCTCRNKGIFFLPDKTHNISFACPQQ